VLKFAGSLMGSVSVSSPRSMEEILHPNFATRRAAQARSLICGALLLSLSTGAAAADVGAAAQAAISAYRKQHGLSAVTVDARLMQLAREHANAMARAGVMDHNVGGAFASRIARYNPSAAAENIAAGYRDFGSVLAIWKRSPGHNANLLKAGVTRIGIASANAPGSRYKIFWTLILARPDDGPKRRAPRGGPPVMFLR
jgi:uncharacterized protein YkwD